jgi:chromosome segregation ATPase
VASKDPDWLGELRWQGYPRQETAPAKAGAAAPVPPSNRIEQLARENESLRARLEQLGRLAGDFERRLAEAGTAYESAVIEAESRLRDAAMEREHAQGELEAARSEAARMAARDAAREAEMRLERERRADAEKALDAARWRLEALEAEAQDLRGKAAERDGAMAELRRLSSTQNERLLQAKVLTDQDVQLLRQELRDFLARFHRLSDEMGEK